MNGDLRGRHMMLSRNILLKENDTTLIIYL